MADDAQKKHDSPPPQAQPAVNKAMAYSEPGLGGHGVPQPIPDAYSAAPGDTANRAARADGVAANRNEDKQDLQGGGHKKARIDDVTKLVAEENASRSKFPRYQGLERWELIEKMGDGAFSNVFRARDTEGKVGEVAIKVVRKFEMNSMQVSWPRPMPRLAVSSHSHVMSTAFWCFGVLVFDFPIPTGDPHF